MTRTALALALLCAPLSAQVTHTARTSSVWEAVVLDSGLGTIVDQDTLPPGTVLDAVNGTLLAASPIGICGVPGSVGAGASSILTLGPSSIAVEATTSSATMAGCSAQFEAFFDATFDWTLNAATPTAGELHVTIRNPHFAPGYTTEVSVEDLQTGLEVDLPDSGAPTFAELLLRSDDRWSVSTPFAIDNSRSVRVHVRSEAPPGAFGSTSTQLLRAVVELEFVQSTSGPVSIDGAPCGANSNGFVATLRTQAGATLARRIGLHGFGHPPSTFGQFFVFGTVDPALPIPPTNCLLRTDILAPVLIPGFASEVALEIPVALPVHGVLRTQFLAGEMMGPTALWSTSEAVVLGL